jgi:hypothetical protein
MARSTIHVFDRDAHVLSCGLASSPADGIFDCFGAGLGVCLTATCCPCVQYGRNVRILGNGEFCQHCVIFACCAPFSCLCAGPKRGEMRNQYRLKVRQHHHTRTGTVGLHAGVCAPCHMMCLPQCIWCSAFSDGLWRVPCGLFPAHIFSIPSLFFRSRWCVCLGGVHQRLRRHLLLRVLLVDPDRR